MHNFEFKLFKLPRHPWSLWTCPEPFGAPLFSDRAAIRGCPIKEWVFEPFPMCAYLNYYSVFYGHRLILHHFITLTTLCSLLGLGYQISLSTEYFMAWCLPLAQWNVSRLICRRCSLMLAFALIVGGILPFCHCYYLIGSNGHVKYSF